MRCDRRKQRKAEKQKRRRSTAALGPCQIGVDGLYRASKSVTLRKGRNSGKGGQEGGKMSTDPAEFRSPKRALARSFRLSRDRWKEKAGQRRKEIRALMVRLRDLQVSRDLWKQKAAALQAQLDLLQASAPPACSAATRDLPDESSSAASPPAEAHLAEPADITPAVAEPALAAPVVAEGSRTHAPTPAPEPPEPPAPGRSAQAEVKKKTRAKSRRASS
jgi:hypothetical protein